MKKTLVFALVLGLASGTIPVWSQQQTQQQQDQNACTSAQAAAAAEQLKADREKEAARLSESRDVLKGMLTGHGPVAKALVDKAKCVVVIPRLKRAAFIFGVNYGRGMMSCHLGDNFDGPWSAPSMYSIEGANFGFQIGVQSTDLILLVMNERGVNSLLRTKSTLGGDVSVAAGPFGRGALAATDLGMKADLLAFSRTGGVYAGVSINGGTLRPDNDGNDVLYGRQLTAKEILRSGEVAATADGRPVVHLLDQSADIAAAGKTPGDNK
jgi:SH3 domain-containing YSC84-like protein 1